MINTIIELEKEAGAGAEWKVGRGGTAGDSATNDGLGTYNCTCITLYVL